MLSGIPVQTDPRILVDYRTADDAGVYAWEGGPALVQTVDFFTPIVDDPYLYGQIAAANALSDVYAMGGRPLTALAIAAFPEDDLDTETIAAIFRGGFDKLREAGVALLGGHTIRDREIKFGYAITGAVDPARILTNAGAKAGDRLILTKPLGTGVVGHRDQIRPRAAARRRTGRVVDAHAEQGGGRSDRDSRRHPRLHRHHRLRFDRSRFRNGRGKSRHDRDRRRRGSGDCGRAGDGRSEQVRAE